MKYLNNFKHCKINIVKFWSQTVNNANNNKHKEDTKAKIVA